MLVAKLKIVTIAAAGTRVPVIAASKMVTGSVSFLPSSVTTSAFVGDVTVSSTVYGIKLLAAQTLPTTIPIGDGVLDLATLYIDSTTNGDKVAVLYFEKVSR